MSFLTVEDVNGTLLKYGSVNMFHVIDTKKISEEPFKDVKYDFCTITHRRLSQTQHIFDFSIVNKNWQGGFYFTDENDVLIQMGYHYNNVDREISLTTPLNSVKLVLYCSNIPDEFDKKDLNWRPISLNSIIRAYNDKRPEKVEVVSLKNENLAEKKYKVFGSENNFIKEEGKYYMFLPVLNEVEPLFVECGGVRFYYDVLWKKLNLSVYIEKELLISKVNRVELIFPNYIWDENVLPQSTQNMLKGTVYYDNKEIPLQFDENNLKYYFNLDLREKTDTKPVKLRLKLFETDYIQETVQEFDIKCKYVSVNNFIDLIKELIVDRSKIIEIGDEFELLNDIVIHQDTVIYGKGFELNLNNHSIIVDENITLKVYNLSFSNGNTAIVQRINSKLELNNCRFLNCISSEYNNLGSCIFCDINLESLSVDDDFLTNLSNCYFKDNHSTIFHGGQLTVNNCKFKNYSVDNIDKNNPAFVYQIDGNATISNSIFDINYDNNDLCSNNENIGFAQALIECGETATVNTATHKSLQSNDSLPFFKAPYNNKAHLLAKYYYPKVNSCVFSSPNDDYEDMSCCHCVSGIDWVFKNNVKITKESWNNENKLHKIEWEDD